MHLPSASAFKGIALWLVMPHSCFPPLRWQAFTPIIPSIRTSTTVPETPGTARWWKSSASPRPPAAALRQAPWATPESSPLPGDFKFGTGGLTVSTDRDYISLPQETFSSTAAYTIAFWARVAAPVVGEATTATTFDLVMGDRSDTNNFIALGQNSTSRFRGNGIGVYQQDFQGAGVGNVWHHYAFVADGLGGLKIYVDNGTPTSYTGKNTNFLYDTIGEAYNLNTTSNDFDFHGEIDEVWVFDEAVSATEINSLFTSNTTSLVNEAKTLHHRYDGNFNDSSGQSNTGIPAGAAAITTTPGMVVEGSGALSLDGEDASFVTLTKPLSFSASVPWSTAWWAKRGSLGTDKGMVMGNASNTTDFIWLNDSFTGLRFRASDNTTYNFTTPKDTLLHHYALVADGAGSITLYLDGVPTETFTGNTAFSIDTIGKAYPNTSLHYNFLGTLDEVHVYENALSAGDVTALYQAELPPGDISVTRLRIILLGGQSNADGRATVSGLPTSPVNLQQPQADVDFFYKVEGGTAALTTLRPGPERNLAVRSRDHPRPQDGGSLGGRDQHPRGHHQIRQRRHQPRRPVERRRKRHHHRRWHRLRGFPTNRHRRPSRTRRRLSVRHARTSRAMVWLQGESDAVAGYASSYQTNLTNFIADVRATYGADLPFVIARLSSGQTNLNSHLSEPGPRRAGRRGRRRPAHRDPVHRHLRTQRGQPAFQRGRPTIDRRGLRHGSRLLRVDDRSIQLRGHQRRPRRAKRGPRWRRAEQLPGIHGGDQSHLERLGLRRRIYLLRRHRCGHLLCLLGFAFLFGRALPRNRRLVGAGASAALPEPVPPSPARSPCPDRAASTGSACGCLDSGIAAKEVGPPSCLSDLRFPRSGRRLEHFLQWSAGGEDGEIVVIDFFRRWPEDAGGDLADEPFGAGSGRHRDPWRRKRTIRGWRRPPRWLRG